MSFPASHFCLFYRITHQNTGAQMGCARKEEEYGYLTICFLWLKEKTSASAFMEKYMQGSVTVEAVICIPLFLYAAICLIWMLQLRAIQIRVRCALHEAGTQLAFELTEVPFLLPSDLENKITDIIGQEVLEKSMISGGIQCNESFMWPSTGIMELKAKYKVKLPVPFFRIPKLEYEESMRIKAWTGYVKNGIGNGGNIETIVYVTETGIVYHKDYHCSYLEPSLRQVSKEAMDSLRNVSGGKYYPCVVCARKESNHYYITDYGEKYHTSLSCVGIKRKIYAVPLSEVKGKGVCSKCGQ